MKTNYLVFSDLDGTLLEHNSYSFAPATEALELIKQNSIPLILTTSKTFQEVITLQKDLDIREPIIVENGAGIFIPAEYALLTGHAYEDEWIKISDSTSYIELREFFCDMQKEFPIKGFGDMSVKEVMQLTGLDEKSASDAMKRDFSEPFLLEDETQLETLKEKANAKGLDVIKGGRFFHLVSLNHDKAEAMLYLSCMYEKYYNCEYIKVALGDSANDFTMLQEANIGVLIPLHDGSFAPLQSSKVLHAKFPGPKGWNNSIKEIFDVR